MAVKTITPGRGGSHRLAALILGAAAVLVAAATAVTVTEAAPTCTFGSRYVAKNGVLSVLAAARTDDDSPEWVSSTRNIGTGGTNDDAPMAPQEVIAWKPNRTFTDIQPPGETARLTYPFTVTETGHYRLMMRSAAPFITEKNDVWLSLNWPRGASAYIRDRSSSGADGNNGPDNNWGLKLTSTEEDSGYLKVYQNRGNNEFNWDSFTVDNNPHIIVSRWLDAGSNHTLRLAARSTTVEVHRLVLFRCDKKDPEGCNDGGASWRAATNAPLSQCA